MVKRTEEDRLREQRIKKLIEDEERIRRINEEQERRLRLVTKNKVHTHFFNNVACAKNCNFLVNICSECAKIIDMQIR